MNVEKALKLLNLSANYTEIDLKREYRKLVLEYHPDKHADEDKDIYEEKTKLLNKAKSVLYENLKYRKQFNNNEESFDFHCSPINKEEYDDVEELSKLKRQYKEELCNELDYIYDVNSRDNLFMKWKDRFLEVIYDLYLCLDDQPDTFSLNINYELYKKQYFELLSCYLYDHFNTSDVMSFVNNEVKVDITDGLKSIRTKMIMSINIILNKILDEFKKIEDYYDIESLLLELRNNFTDLCLWGYINIEKAKIAFKNKIVLELKKYRKRKQLVDNLIKFYGYPNKLTIKLYNSILNEEKFNSLYYDGVDTKTRIRVKINNIFSK